MKPLFLAVIALLTGSAPEPITGYARVVDGDTLVIDHVHIRIFGIDAPEAAQFCLDSRKMAYACGGVATAAMDRLTAGRVISCYPRDTDRYGRTVAVCRTGDLDLGREMVREGWAVSFRRYSRDYDQAEADARADHRGMWAGQFQWPWDFRRDHRR